MNKPLFTYTNILPKYQYDTTAIQVHNITLYLTSRKAELYTRLCCDPHGLPLTKVRDMCGPVLGSNKSVCIHRDERYDLGLVHLAIH
jgi:hypothetical protein